MIRQLRDWYLGLTGRERVLVTIAGALAALVIAIYGVVLPLGRAHDAAHVRLGEATIAAGDVRAGLRQLETAPDQMAGGGPVSPIVASLAEEQGIVLQANEARGDAVAVIAIPTAAPAAAFAFLDLLRGQGIAVEQVTVSPAADGSVAVSATLRRAGS